MAKAIVIHKPQLPAKIEELNQFIIISNEAIKAYKAKIGALKKTGAAQEAIKGATFDGIGTAEMLFEALARLGKLLKATVTPGGSPKRTAGGMFNGAEPSLPSGITKRRSYEAQQFSRRRLFWENLLKRIFRNSGFCACNLPMMCYNSNYERCQKFS